MSKKITVIFESMGLSLTAEPDTTIFDIAAKRNIPIRSDCGGKGLCGKCLVIVKPAGSLSPLTEPEMDLLTQRQRYSSYRLACKARIRGPISVTIPEQLADSKEARGKTKIGGTYRRDPAVERLVLSYKKPPALDTGVSSDMVGWVKERAKELTSSEVCFNGPDALRQLSISVADKGEITLVNHAQRGVTAVLSGRREQSLGLAVDMGTTTLAAYLCDLQKGTVLTAAASVNPQRRFGEDVISRIAMADEQESGLMTLQGLIVEGINYLINRCVEQVGASREDIDEVTMVGNTTMEQIVASLHPHGLGVSPYLPVTRTPPDLKANDLGLDINPGTNVHIFPVISGFVGGDTLGGIVADGTHKRNEITLGLDLGTNGEVFLGNKEGLWATSCATGPAFEGAQISCGMRAVSGAIHRVDIDPETLQVKYQVLGNESYTMPIGICGSGIIDAVASLRKVRLLLPNGRLKEDMPGVICDESGIGRSVVIVPAERSGTGNAIAITLHDIRQIQLAKAALQVGIEFLMRKLGVTHVDRTVLTGAFGARFDWRSAITIGMLPRKEMCGEIVPQENLAGVGAIMGLLDKKLRIEAAEVSRHIKFLELGQEPDFVMKFAKATNFP
jgi:uncharacterized 2Fe-2S/4Fe-4S cluster protein (DUF4445 family)